MMKNKISWAWTILSSNKPHFLKVLKFMFFKWHGETWVQFTAQPKGTVFR